MNSSVRNILPCIILFRSPSYCLSISSDQIDVRSSFHIDSVSKQCALLWPCPTKYGRLFCWSVSIAEMRVVLRKQFCKIPSRLQKKKMFRLSCRIETKAWNRRIRMNAQNVTESRVENYESPAATNNSNLKVLIWRYHHCHRIIKKKQQFNLTDSFIYSFNLYEQV